MKRLIIVVPITILLIASSAATAWYLINKGAGNAKQEQVLADQSEENDLLDIKKALANKHGWDENKVDIVLQKRIGDYATGAVGGKTLQDGGGVWFAAKVNGEWKIVWDGKGSVMCSDLIDYPEYPSELIAECYNLKTGKIVER